LVDFVCTGAGLSDPPFFQALLVKASLNQLTTIFHFQNNNSEPVQKAPHEPARYFAALGSFLLAKPLYFVKFEVAEVPEVLDLNLAQAMPHAIFEGPDIGSFPSSQLHLTKGIKSVFRKSSFVASNFIHQYSHPVTIFLCSFGVIFLGGKTIVDGILSANQPILKLGSGKNLTDWESRRFWPAFVSRPVSRLCRHPVIIHDSKGWDVEILGDFRPAHLDWIGFPRVLGSLKTHFILSLICR